MRVYVKVKREENHDGDRLLKVTTHYEKPKNYSFDVKLEDENGGKHEISHDI